MYAFQRLQTSRHSLRNFTRLLARNCCYTERTGQSYERSEEVPRQNQIMTSCTWTAEEIDQGGTTASGNTVQVP